MKLSNNQNNTNIISIFYTILMSLLVSSCATYNVGEAPLTVEEIANYQNANPDAFTISYVNDLEFDVTNTTYEDRDITGKRDIDRWIKIYKEFDKYPIINILAQKRVEIAKKTCQAKDMISEFKYYKNFSTRYKCISYNEKGFQHINFGIEQCGKAAQGERYAQIILDMYTSHPCEKVVFDQKYCKTFSDRFDIQQGQVVSCQELKQKRDRALYKQNIDSTIEYQTPKAIEKSYDFADAEKKCTELGFKAKSEKFADCVIKLSR